MQCVVDRGIWHIEPNRTVKPAMISIAKPLNFDISVFYRRRAVVDAINVKKCYLAGVIRAISLPTVLMTLFPRVQSPRTIPAQPIAIIHDFGGSI